jgi:hypothetical protein
MTRAAVSSIDNTPSNVSLHPRLAPVEIAAIQQNPLIEALAKIFNFTP